jgi:DNA-binding GntR family transcriptional regulator
VYGYLLKKIIEGELKYGDVLNIKKLSEELAVSTMPVREALKRLEYEKIVEIKPRSSCQIRIPSKIEIREIYELREVLELYAIRKFRDQHDASRLVRIREITDLMKTVEQEPDEESRVKKAIILDRQFHAEICRLADNRQLNSVYDQLNLHLNMTMIHEKTYIPLRDVYYQSHAEILRCLEKKTNGEELDACVRKHFDNVKGYLFS